MKPYYTDDSVTLWHGDALAVLRELPDGSVDCCVTSPPYFGLRDYGVEGQQGLESSPAEYVAGMVAVFAEVRRVLADDGTLWLNIGDSYASSTKGSGGATAKQSTNSGAFFEPRSFNAGVPAKNLMGIPWRVAFALQDDGWILRNDIIWAKPNAMPTSVMDRLKNSHEHIFLFSKSRRYHFDLEPIRDEPKLTEADINKRATGSNAHKYDGQMGRIGRSRPPQEVIASMSEIKGANPGDVWVIPSQPFAESHFAVMPQQLASRAIQAGCKPGGTVLDPFSGSGTTGLAAAKHGRKYVGIDLNADYLDLSLRTRLAQAALFDDEASA